LKRPCQKSLPSSLFQREESFGGFDGEFLPLFPLLGKGSCEKIERREAKASFIAPSPGIPAPPKFFLPEFFHSFRGMKGDLTAFQKAKLLQKPEVLSLRSGV
jgi:hypothetical protein